MPRVLGLHMVELRAGVGGVEFESFVLEKFLPALSALDVPGVEFHLFKADRGARDKKFLFTISFESKEIRDRYFPGHNQPSEELLTLIHPLQGLSQVWEQLPEREKTDYIQLDGGL
jgi:hypothetical protein